MVTEKIAFWVSAWCVLLSRYYSSDSNRGGRGGLHGMHIGEDKCIQNSIPTLPCCQNRNMSRRTNCWKWC